MALHAHPLQFKNNFIIRNNKVEVEYGLASHETFYIGHIGDGFLRVKWPDQQCQSTEER